MPVLGFQGEAKIVKTPILVFEPPLPWRSTTNTVVDASRYHPVTSSNMQGARWYCWLHPGETVPQFPDATTFQEGALVYSFGEDANCEDERNCVFPVATSRGRAGALAHAEATSFPQSLKPFAVIPTTELDRLITVDIETGTYTIDLTQQNLPPQVDCLRTLYPADDNDVNDGDATTASPAKPSLRKELIGNISGLCPIPAEMTPFNRRRQRIPMNATHFVWAYQLPPWFTNELSAEQLAAFKPYAGEISLASFGGLIYVDIADPRTGGNAAKVVGVNALSLGGTVPFRQGVIDLADNHITASISSPELIDGIDIGIETDMYSLGIVMWEVFTRREAWHWLKNLDKPNEKIAFQAALNDMRPKCPVGLTDHCTLMVRRLLHADLSKRPTAKDVTAWLQQQIYALQKYIEDEKVFQASEREARGAMTNKRKVLDIQKRYACLDFLFASHHPPPLLLRPAGSAQGSLRGCRVDDIQKVQSCC